MIFVWLSHALLVYTQADLYPILSLLMRSRHQSLGFTILGCQSLWLLGLVLGMSASRSLSFKSLPGQCLGVYCSHSFGVCGQDCFGGKDSNMFSLRKSKIFGPYGPWICGAQCSRFISFWAFIFVDIWGLSLICFQGLWLVDFALQSLQTFPPGSANQLFEQPLVYPNFGQRLTYPSLSP